MTIRIVASGVAKSVVVAGDGFGSTAGHSIASGVTGRHVSRDQRGGCSWIIHALIVGVRVTAGKMWTIAAGAAGANPSMTTATILTTMTTVSTMTTISAGWCSVDKQRRRDRERMRQDRLAAQRRRRNRRRQQQGVRMLEMAPRATRVYPVGRIEQRAEGRRLEQVAAERNGEYGREASALLWSEKLMLVLFAVGVVVVGVGCVLGVAWLVLHRVMGVR